MKNKKDRLKLVDLNGMGCCFLEDSVLLYHVLYFKVVDNEGFYAYSENETDVIELRHELIENKLFNPLELKIIKLKNIPAILKYKRESRVHV